MSKNLSPERAHLPELDGLRGIAIILVIVAHTTAGSLGMPGPWYRLGGLGVMLFFVLSGFLITGVLITSEERYGRIDLREFYARRALRIFPAAYAFLAFVMVAIALRWVTDVSWPSFAAAALYLRNIFGRDTTLGHLWSLSIEEQFYCLWPAALVLAGLRRGLRIAVIATFGFTLFRTAAIAWRWFPYETGVFYERPWFRFDSLLIGCCFTLFRHQSPMSWQRLAARIRATRSLFWVAPAAIAWTLWFEDRAWAHPIHLTVQLLLVAVVFLGVLSTQAGGVRDVLIHPVLRMIGRLSYSLYLWQQIFTVITPRQWGLVGRFPVNIAVLGLTAYASYRFVERPFLQFKESAALRNWLAAKRNAQSPLAIVPKSG